MAGRELGAGAWSYFGDPRAISHDGDTFTGWISTAGHVWVARLTRSGRLSKHLLRPLRGRRAVQGQRRADRQARRGSLRDRRLDRIYRYSDSGGRAWPHDIALTAEGRPRVVYTRRLDGPTGRDTFWYAHHNGEKWISRKIVEAGAGRNSFTSGGATFDHEDPRLVYLSRTIGRWNRVELWLTPDNGRTWTHEQITDDTDHYSIRPVRPRGLAGANGPRARRRRALRPLTRITVCTLKAVQ